MRMEHPPWTLLTQTAWEKTQECLPALTALHEEPYWDPASGQGLCAHAAAWLHLLLLKEGKTSSIATVQGHIIGHCFVVCEGFRLDPTAMQFGALTPLVEPHEEDADTPWYYCNPIMHESVSALCMHLDNLGAPSPQTPIYLVEAEAYFKNAAQTQELGM